jgi:peroxiredoxin (alkyl hydroperoxide reductase subunit C)
MTTLVSKIAPDFNAKAAIGNKIVEDFSISQFLGRYVIFFFYPLDFTFVCPTELHAFQDQLEEFEKRQCEVIACSVDSCHTHHAWLNTPRKQGGIEGIDYPIVSDLNKTIAKDYGVLNIQEGIAFRGLFLIDRQGIIWHQIINDLPLGRSVDETLRILDALIYFEQNGEVCPANWQKGERSMKPTKEGLERYFATSP